MFDFATFSVSFGENRACGIRKCIDGKNVCSTMREKNPNYRITILDLCVSLCVCACVQYHCTACSFGGAAAADANQPSNVRRLNQRFSTLFMH